jgi:CEP19-like protein
MASKIQPLKFGLKYSPPCIILEYQLGEKKRRRVMPVRGLVPDSDVHDVVDKLIDSHSQLDPGIVPTEQVWSVVRRMRREY